MLPKVGKLLGRGLDLFFPRFCVGCGREGEFICPSCQKELARLTPPICPRCGLPKEGEACADCLNLKAIDGIRSPFKFEGVIREAIYQLKYGGVRALASPLGSLLYQFLLQNPLPVDILVPVPLHRKRLRERGYNQSSLLAKELGKLSNLKVVEGFLVRHRHTPPQAKTISAAERRNNVADAFTCVGGRLLGKRVLLIDDVATSGATLDFCAQALKEGGASSVWGLTLAREI